MRSYDERVRDQVLAAIERIVRAEAAASGAPAEPEIEYQNSTFPPWSTTRPPAPGSPRCSTPASGLTLDPGPVTGSEDVGLLATAAGVPCGYWLLGGADPALFAGIATLDEARAVVDRLPPTTRRCSPRWSSRRCAPASPR